MMSTVTLQEAQSHLSELIEKLAPGEGVTITKDDRPVARLVIVPFTEVPRPVLGRCQGMLTVLAEDDEHLEDFSEYMP
jgi:prevent-host-death family protein